MIAYKCAKCGAGELEPLGDGKKAVCQYCFSVMVLPTLDPEALHRALIRGRRVCAGRETKQHHCEEEPL